MILNSFDVLNRVICFLPLREPDYYDHDDYPLD